MLEMQTMKDKPQEGQAAATAFNDMATQKQYMDVWFKYLEQVSIVVCIFV